MRALGKDNKRKVSVEEAGGGGGGGGGKMRPMQMEIKVGNC